MLDQISPVHSSSSTRILVLSHHLKYVELTLPLEFISLGLRQVVIERSYPGPDYWDPEFGTIIHMYGTLWLEHGNSIMSSDANFGNPRKAMTGYLKAMMPSALDVHKVQASLVETWALWWCIESSDQQISHNPITAEWQTLVYHSPGFSDCWSQCSDRPNDMLEIRHPVEDWTWWLFHLIRLQKQHKIE